MFQAEQARESSGLRAPQVSASLRASARNRLNDRGLDPDQHLGQGEAGDEITTLDLYLLLGILAASEKSGQGPTHALARLALHARLNAEIADTLFLAYNQQSAEEAGHGDKVFGNAYYVMGGAAPEASFSVVGDGAADFLAPDADPNVNAERLVEVAAVIGGIETVALQRAFPNLTALCERWNHPIGHDVIAQIRDIVRPEEARHVLNFRYVFHRLIAPKDALAVESYFRATNAGRAQVNAPPFDREHFARLVGSSSPTPQKLLGKG